MAYNNDNYLEKVRQAVRVTKVHYEPGRQNRSHLWVWRTHIHDMFHINYRTYLKWLRENTEYAAYMKSLREARIAERLALREERARNPRRVQRAPAPKAAKQVS